MTGCGAFGRIVKHDPIMNGLMNFTNHFKEMFGQTTNTFSVRDQLFHLNQGNLSVAE